MPQAFSDRLAELPPNLLHQLRDVLRLKSGDSVTVFDGNGKEGIAHLFFEARQGYLVVHEVFEVEPPRPCVVLLQALIRPANFELIVQKATELGVSVIQPVLSRHSQPYSPSPHKQQRWHKIAVEAAEQCGRAHLPRIEPPIALATALKKWAYGLLLIAYEGEEHTLLPTALRGSHHEDRVTIAVGPEGGFAEDEVLVARATGYKPVSLGPWRLRSETAAIAALATIMAAALK